MGDDYRLYIRDESGPFFSMGQNLGWAKSSKVEQSWAKSSKVEQSWVKHLGFWVPRFTTKPDNLSTLVMITCWRVGLRWENFV